MNNMEELKSVVMKTLESQGILGEIRAKLRTNVFKVLGVVICQIIEQQDTNVKTNAGFYLENPLAAKLMENPDILLCAELVRDFLEFYKMDFTLQIFVPECNLPLNDRVADKLEAKLKLKRTEPAVPALVQIMQAFQKGGFTEVRKESNDMASTKYGSFGLDQDFM